MAAWRERLDTTPGVRVGVAWQGNPKFKQDRRRSMPLRFLEPLGTTPGFRLIALQKEHGRGQIGALDDAPWIEDLGHELDNGPDAFIDTAAVMMNLDLVVSINTSIAHLAGALARPVWVALDFVPNWRWMMERTDSPWYPTARMFRQPVPGEWSAVFAEIVAALGGLARRPDRQHRRFAGDRSSG